MFLKNSQFSILNINVLSNTAYLPKPSLSKVIEIDEFLKSDSGNNFDFTDLQPFIDLNWVKNYFADGKDIKKNGFETKTTLKYHRTLKTITNFNSETTSLTRRPIVNFLTETGQSITPQVLKSNDNFFNEFYKDRKFNNQFINV